MKKLIVLFAILAMVNVASAGIVDIVISSLNGLPITPVKEITILPTDWINVDVIYTPSDPGWFIWSIAKEMVITPAGVPNVSGMTADIGSITWPAAPHDWLEPGVVSKVTMLPNGNPYITVGARAFPPEEVLPGIVLDHFLFHCEGLGLVTIVLVENTDGAPDGSNEMDPDITPSYLAGGPGIIIHQVPEPMTLVLLGLGSLFLARRKK